jgi:hypothetical protein
MITLPRFFHGRFRSHEITLGKAGAEMIAYQLTVPTENTPGKLARVSGILSRKKINIRAITISSFGDKGFFNILADDPKLALKALSREGIEARLQEVIAVVIDDRPGGMDRLVQILAGEGINIENAYGFVLESSKTAVFVVDVSDTDKAQKVLKEHGFKTLTPESLAAIEPFHYMKY